MNNENRYKVSVREITDNELGFKQVYSESIDHKVDKYFVAKLEILNNELVLIGLNY